MKQVLVYKCLDGTLEQDYDAVIARDLCTLAKRSTVSRGEPLSMAGAKWIVKHKELVIRYLTQGLPNETLL